MPHKVKKIRLIFLVYWFLVLYIIAALIWWFIALNQQNKQMTSYKKNRLELNSNNYNEQYLNIIKEEKRKEGQYIGEGSIFLLLITAGAFFLFRAVRSQLKLSIQQQNFMIAITHELKTPIAITKLNLETLQKRKLDESQHEKLINNTLQEASRMNALCNNLLLSSQMDAGGYQYANEKTDLSELTENCIKEFSARYPQKKIIKKIDAGVYVIGDYFLLQMAINNLIDNAIKYAPRDSDLEIGLTERKDNCELCIIDQGFGIVEIDKKKIFEKYYRSGSEATQKSKGTGLGLFLVKRIIDTHKGKIIVTDNIPRGSKFSIVLKTIA